jgi:pimeloyl-ACP methyl ester carboxylesterase
MRRALAVAVIVALVAWLLVPLARAVSLVSPHPSDLAAPADLAVDDLRISADAEARGTVPLAAWSLHVTHGDPAVVLVHGFKTSRAEMLPWARFLHDGGFNVLLFDTRGCGRSGGATVGLGATEPRDISLAVEAAQAEFGTTRIAVLGVSLGAGAAILAAAADPRIAAVVADSAWTSQDFTLSRLDTLPLGPIRLPLVPYSGALVNALVGADVHAARPIDAIARVSPRPVLLIHSADDENATTTPDGARRLYEAAAAPKDLWMAPRGGHAGAINAVPDEYRSRVLGFLRAALR